MRYSLIQALRRRLFFTIEDVQNLTRIAPESTRVLCSRYTKEGVFIRLKRNLYTLDQRWQLLSNEESLKISNFLQVPSYVSFMTALSFYEVTSQVQMSFFENSALKRSRKFNINGKRFNFYKLKKNYYFGFIKKGDIFIATKEKAFIDAMYLYSFGKYKLDISSLDMNKLDKGKLKQLARVFPKKTKKVLGEICKI